MNSLNPPIESWREDYNHEGQRDNPSQPVRSRSNSPSFSVDTTTTQRLMYSPLTGKESLLRLLHERSLEILEGILWQVSVAYRDQEDFADIVKSFKDEVIRMRLWGKEVDAETMSVVESSSELRSVVTAILQQVASMLLNCTITRSKVQVYMLTMAGACIRPPSGWRSEEYQELKHLHDEVESGTSVETEQSQRDGPDENASPYLEIAALKELILDLRCCTGTLMDIVPVIEYTKDVSSKYISPRPVLETKQTNHSLPIASSTQDNQVKVKAPEQIRAAIQRDDVPESQRHVSHTSSHIPPTHAPDNRDSGRTTIQNITTHNFWGVTNDPWYSLTPNARFSKGDIVRKPMIKNGARTTGLFTIHDKRYNRARGFHEYQLQDIYSLEMASGWTRERELKPRS